MKAAGIDIKETEVCEVVLSGLPMKYDIIVTVLQNQTEELALDLVLPHLLPVEQLGRKEVHGEVTGSSVPIYGFSGPRQETRKCFYCGKAGHIKRNCQTYTEDKAKTRNGVIAI